MWLLAAVLGSAILGIGYVSERAHTGRRHECLRHECLRRGGEPVDTGRMGRDVVCLKWGAVLP